MSAFLGPDYPQFRCPGTTFGGIALAEILSLASWADGDRIWVLFSPSQAVGLWVLDQPGHVPVLSIP